MGKICYVHPAQSTKAGLRYREKLYDMLKKKGVLHPDTEITIRTIETSTVTLPAYTESWYFDLLQRQHTVESVIQAEKDGFDAAIIGCYFDPGIDEAREMVDIPVVGVMEASFAFAHMFTAKKGKFAILNIAEKGCVKIEEIIRKWGFEQQMMPINPVRLISQDLYVKVMTVGKPADIKAFKEQCIQVARECVRDGAEVIIPGCGGVGPLLATEGVKNIDGALVLDPVTCSFKIAEALIGLKKFGFGVSRRLYYRQLSAADTKKERAHFGFKD